MSRHDAIKLISHIFFALPFYPTQVHEKGIKVYKGVDGFVESYSSFFDVGKRGDTGLSDALQRHFVTDIYVCGLATDVCVGTVAAA